MNDTLKILAQVVGVVLTVVGIVGFFTDGNLLVFGVNGLHNVVHLLTGVIGLWAGFSGGGDYAQQYNKWLGVVYVLVAVLGFVAVGFMETLLNVNMADNILHLVLGVVLAGVGFGMKSS